jgi:hypothetical protein
MKKLIYAILILLLCLGIYSCGKNDAASTATTAATDNSSSPEVIIFPYSTDYQYPYNAHKAAYGCSGTNSSGSKRAPFFSTSTHDLKDRLPTSKWSYPIKSLQGHIISSSWENLWDGNIEMSLSEAEVVYDNSSSGYRRGFWSATKSDGTFSGNDCTGWSSQSSSDNATIGSFQIKEDSRWIDNETRACNSVYTYFLCFMYN